MKRWMFAAWVFLHFVSTQVQSQFWKKLHFTVLPSLSLADIVEAVDDDVDVNDKVQAHIALVYYAFAFQPFWFICVFTLFKFIQGL